MRVASRLLPFRANRLANIIPGGIMTVVNGFLTFVLPLTNGAFRDPVFPAYVFFGTIRNCMHLGHHLAAVDLVNPDQLSG